MIMNDKPLTKKQKKLLARIGLQNPDRFWGDERKTPKKKKRIEAMSKFKVGQQVFFMENNKPRQTDIFAVIEYDGGTNYLFSNEVNPSAPDKFWLHRDLDNNTKYIKHESEIFKTKDDLMKSLFK